MALAVPLLIVAGLLIRSVDRLEGQDLAVNRGHVLLVDFGPSLSAIPERTATAVRRDLLDRVREQPDVADATFASQTPLGGGVHGSSLRVEGRPLREDRDAVAAFVGPGYFHTVGIPLVTGRDFSAQDDAAHPPVVVLSETAARVFGADMLGHRVAYGTRPFAEVIGIAKDVKFTSLREAAPRQVYLAQLQNGALGGRLVVRTDGDPLAVTASLRDTIRRAAPNLPITKMTTLDEEIRAKTAGGARAGDDGDGPCQRDAARLRHRPVRIDRVHGRAPHARVRHPHGARRIAGTGDARCRGERAATRRRRIDRRRDRRGRHDESRRLAALRRQPRRLDRARRVQRGAARRGARRKPRPCRASKPRRSR
jgi:MacB-like periplasmic core domain